MNALEEAAADALDRAAARLEPKGAWCKGTYRKWIWDPKTGTSHNAYCLMGALREEAHASSVRQTAIVSLVEEIHAENPKVGITRWNDNQRDKRKVIRLMRRVAKKLRNS